MKMLNMATSEYKETMLWLNSECSCITKIRVYTLAVTSTKLDEDKIPNTACNPLSGES